jgi:hypothetical protein
MVKEELNSSLFSLKQLSEKIKEGDVSPVDLVGACYGILRQLEYKYSSFILADTFLTVRDSDLISVMKKNS